MGDGGKRADAAGKRCCDGSRRTMMRRRREGGRCVGVAEKTKGMRGKKRISRALKIPGIKSIRQAAVV